MNKVFQWFWYNVGKRLNARKTDKKTGIVLDDYSDRFVTQLRLSKLFGGADLVFLGNSNAEELADYESMKRMKKLSLNFGIGGLRGDHVVDFFTNSSVGKKLYEEIKDKKIVLNAIGNHVLQKRMDNLVETVEALHKLFPRAYWINIPSVWGNIIAGLQGRTVEEIDADLEFANAQIARVAQSRLLDITPFTGSDETAPYWFVHKDAVHYSDEFDYKVRIPLINKVVYGINV